ncbi:hypothetical protein BY996DRAFT_4594586, partial [Phakopsora pachyrhizi]
SSQIYLETCLPSLGDCFVSKKTVFFSQTRRHLSEYVHLESELGFISFEELLAHIKELVSGFFFFKKNL